MSSNIICNSKKIFFSLVIALTGCSYLYNHLSYKIFERVKYRLFTNSGFFLWYLLMEKE